MKNHKIILLLIVLISLPLVNLDQFSKSQKIENIDGDWIINENVTKSNTTIKINGSIYIQSGYCLTINNSELFFHPGNRDRISIEIEKHSVLIINNSVLSGESILNVALLMNISGDC